jgi:hypothetical protein
MADDSLSGLWRTLAELFEEIASPDVLHPLTPPALAEDDIYAGAMMGFEAEDARTVLSDDLSLRDLMRVWWRFEEIKGAGVLPSSQQQCIAEECREGGPQWNRALRQCAGFDVSFDDPGDWEAVKASLPADLRDQRPDVFHDDFMPFWEELSAQKVPEELPSRGGEPPQRVWDPAGWQRTWRRGDIRLGAKVIHSGETVVGIYPPTQEGSFELSVTWPGGDSRRVPVQLYQREVTEVNLGGTQGELPKGISIRVSR